MRRFLGISAVAAALSMLACETSRAPVRTNVPAGEYRPNGNGPMRGGESFPAEAPGTTSSTGTSTGALGASVGGSGDTVTGSQIDRDSAVSEGGTGPTNSDRLLTPGTGGTPNNRSSERYQDPNKTGDSSAESSGSSTADRSDSTGNVGSGSRRQGRSTGQDTTIRPRSGRPSTGNPAASDPLGNTNIDNPDESGTPPIPNADGFANPYDLGAAKSPKDGGMMAPHDGGSHFESVPPDALPPRTGPRTY